MKVKNYQELLVWQRAMEVTKLTYCIVKKLPREELFSLSDQMRRAAVSIPSNIAEGFARDSNKEFIHFLHISNGSCAELQTQLQICVQIGYLVETDISEIMSKLNEVGKMTRSLIKSLSTNH